MRPEILKGTGLPKNQKNTHSLHLVWVDAYLYARHVIHLKNERVCVGLVFTCSCPMVGKPGEGPEAMDVTLICPGIWPRLLVAMALLRFMPLPLYMLLLFCWVNCGDACCCENILRETGGEGKQLGPTRLLTEHHHCEEHRYGFRYSLDLENDLFTCCLPCCPEASRSFQGKPGKQRFPGPAASSETVCGPCEERAEDSEVCPDLQSLHLPVGSYLRRTHQHRSTRDELQRLDYNQIC